MFPHNVPSSFLENNSIDNPRMFPHNVPSSFLENTSIDSPRMFPHNVPSSFLENNSTGRPAIFSPDPAQFLEILSRAYQTVACQFSNITGQVKNDLPINNPYFLVDINNGPFYVIEVRVASKYTTEAV